jgi:hypothetical protein
MTRRLAGVALAGVAAAALSHPVAAQAGFGFRAGTLGFGLEAAVDVSGRIAARAGVGLTSLSASTTFDQIPVRLDLPDVWLDIGVDYYLNDQFRVGGGMVLKPNDPVIRGELDGSVDIGGRSLTPDEVGTLAGTLDMDDQTVYALVGFGRHSDSGLGLFVDAGAAVFRRPSVSLAASGGTLPADELQPLLDAEGHAFEDDMKTYIRVWPILSIGLRFGLGG